MEQGLPVSSNFDEIEIVDNLYDFILKLDRMSPSDISGILSSLITTGEAEYEDAHTEREINYSFYLLPVDLED